MKQLEEGRTSGWPMVLEDRVFHGWSTGQSPFQDQNPPAPRNGDGGSTSQLPLPACVVCLSLQPQHNKEWVPNNTNI